MTELVDNPYYGAISQQQQNKSNNNNNEYIVNNNNSSKLIVDNNNNNNNTEEDFTISIQNQIRIGFIRKVYGILSAQLFVTFILCLLTCLNNDFRKYQSNNRLIFWLSLLGSIGVILVFIIKKEAVKKVPLNYILLIIFTLCKAYMVSSLCSTIRPKIVLVAAVMTMGAVLSITYYSFRTDHDFTIYGGLLFVVLLQFILIGIFCIFFQNKFLYVFYNFLGIVLFSVYIIYDTQLIVGRFQNSIDIDNYILGAMMLYIDIINLFIHLLYSGRS